MDRERVKELEQKAADLRKTAIDMIFKAQSGHPGGSLSAADIMTALYFEFMRVNPADPGWADRDRFVLSKGHVCPILYSALLHRGYMDMSHVETLRKQGSMFQGHPDMKRCPGIDISTGSLGQGFSCAVGMALAGKRDNKDYMTYTLLGDGECNEGQIWEAAQTAAKYELDRLMVFIDNNRLQNDGFTADIMPTGDLEEKFKSFGFQTVRIDGHNMEEIVAAIQFMRSQQNKKPKCIVCNTVKGKGVSFMENVASWHGMAPNKEEYELAVKELERVG